MSKQAERLVVALGSISLSAWLASYSWLLGAALPMRDIEFATSPWLVAEVVAVILGALAVVVALAGSAKGTRMARQVRVAAALGGAAATLSLVSLAL